MFAAFLAFSAVVTSCTSSAKINNVMFAFQDVRSAIIASLPHGLRQEGSNGREMLSWYFSPKNFETEAEDKPERAYAQVNIIGSSRPYKINVAVVRERRLKNGDYTKVGEDERLTDLMVKRIKAVLADRRDDRNVIDDFRAF